MSTWFSQITTKLADASNILRGSTDADGDTEDETYVCRVLRKYYGPEIPNWLPPDPKAPQPIQPVLAETRSRGAASTLRPGDRGGRTGDNGNGNGIANWATKSMSSLWEDTTSENDARPATGGSARPPRLDNWRDGMQNGGPTMPPDQRGGSYQGASLSSTAKLRGRFNGGANTRSASPFAPPSREGFAAGNARQR